jgi:hypothetical protein
MVKIAEKNTSAKVGYKCFHADFLLDLSFDSEDRG